MTRYHLTTRLVEISCAMHGVPFGTSRTLYRRLNKLREQGFIQRTRRLYTGEYAYTLTKTGAGYIFSLDDAVHASPRSISFPSIALQAHEFEVSRFWLKFFSDSKKLHIAEIDFWRDGTFVHLLRDGKKLVPDGTALLSIKGKCRVFFLEMDRGTQTAGYGTNLQAVIRQKISDYQQLTRNYRRHSLLKSHRPIAMRVVFVCRTRQRSQSLLQVARDMNVSDYVCFTHLGQYLDISDPMSANGWDYLRANMFAAPLFYSPARSPPRPLL